jgi:hypothetical protein
MCAEHWAQVPRRLKAQLIALGNDHSSEFLEVLRDSIECVKEMEFARRSTR